ncbi:MAG: hypothetical protein M1818_005667 [Claussenomyces sp. TS43310]|nr:MAG: hypothetical protein M1818_005667 [Claussenomyces sp. TS43310]
MAHETSTSRPLLHPQNRRLRHLKGICVRNLIVTRPRGNTIDDVSLNKSPGKLDALREPELQHSHSTDALNGKTRPSRTRRRSTNWAGKSPGIRQKTLEDVLEAGMTDTFFSIHCEGIDDPIYISELVSRTMNPTFRLFDLSNCAPSIRRLSEFKIKFWSKRQEFRLALEQDIDLRSLNFIGSLEHRTLPPNCVLLHLIDGIYAMDLAPDYPPPKSTTSISTSSYSALMRLSSLDDSIQDALATQEYLASQINAILGDTPLDIAPVAKEEAALSAHFVSTERKILKQSLRKRSELVASLQARRRAIQQGTLVQDRAQADVNNAQEKLQQSQSMLATTTDGIHGQRRRICEELLRIFPIESTSTPLLFTICGLPLPNTSFDDADEDVLAAALGHVARLVDMLQYYLFEPLPYPITPYGSRSIVRDQISTLADGQRTFPLYTKGAVQFRFDYAVFLLNKDIECLADSQGLKVIDIRHTLPNLKYLLYVCSAGSSDLPARKAGGIRGLLSSRIASPVLSRRSSEDSNAARRAFEPKGAMEQADTLQANGAALILPFGSDGPMSLKTRGMKESFVR